MISFWAKKKQARTELKKKKGIFGQKMVEKFSSGAIVDQLKKKVLVKRKQAGAEFKKKTRIFG